MRYRPALQIQGYAGCPFIRTKRLAHLINTAGTCRKQSLQRHSGEFAGSEPIRVGTEKPRNMDP